MALPQILAIFLLLLQHIALSLKTNTILSDSLTQSPTQTRTSQRSKPLTLPSLAPFSSTSWGIDEELPAQFDELFSNASRPSSINPEQEACYSSWYSYLYDVADPSNIGSNQPTTTTSVLVYETIESFAPNSTYKDCDGIPRIRFTGLPTRSIKSLVTVTVSRDHAKSYYLNSTGTKPQCSRLDSYYCRLLYAAYYREVGPDVMSPNRGIARVPEEVCPLEYFCFADIEEVVLIYWPDSVVSKDNCASNGHGSSVTRPWNGGRGSIFTTDAITFKGQDLYLRKINGVSLALYGYPGEGSGIDDDVVAEMWRVWPETSDSYLSPSVMRGNWSFTSPTVYLAHKAFTADQYVLIPDGQQGRGGWGKPHSIRPAGIIPLKPHDVFSLRLNHQSDHINGVRVAQLIASGEFHPVLKAGYSRSLQETHPFDFGDLQNPVPASIYYDARSADCWGQQSHCGTITDDTYRPKLKLARSIWSSIYGDFICEDPMVVDPPISLQPLIEQELKPPQIPIWVPALPSATPIPVQDSGPPKSPAGYGMNLERPRPEHRVASPFPAETSRAGKPWPPMGIQPGHSGWRNTGGQHGNKPQPGGVGSRGDGNNRGDSSVDRNKGAGERHQGIKTPTMFTGESSRKHLSQSHIWFLSLILAGMSFL